jgi:CubicO group peptidase (beta-lactamase class C family)
VKQTVTAKCKIVNKMKMTKAIILLLTIINLSCVYPDYSYQIPEQREDGLDVATLAEVGLENQPIFDAIRRIKGGKYGETHSILIFKNNKLVLEEYFKGHTYKWDAPGHYGENVTWDKDMPHCIHSDTKSITSLCIGIAIDKGFIKSVQQSIFDYLPDYQHLNKNNKEYVTIEHLLTMTSGFHWEEWGVSLASIENDQIGIWFWEDGPINYVLNRELVAVPGTRFNYSGGDIQILVEILKNATGMTLDEFSKKYLFEPLGITSFDWWLRFPNGGDIQGAGGLKITPRDMVKIGAMMLNKGVWNGNRIVSERWVEKCMTSYPVNSGIKIPGEDLGKVGYSYTWWTKDFSPRNDNLNMFFAVGWGGQKIFILPELDMVITFTGANYNSKVKQNSILEKYILTALK